MVLLGPGEEGEAWGLGGPRVGYPASAADLRIWKPLCKIPRRGGHRTRTAQLPRSQEGQHGGRPLSHSPPWPPALVAHELTGEPRHGKVRTVGGAGGLADLAPTETGPSCVTMTTIELVRPPTAMFLSGQREDAAGTKSLSAAK